MEFFDLKAQRRRIGSRMDDAIMSAVNSGACILGPQAEQFLQITTKTMTSSGRYMFRDAVLINM